MAKKKAMPAIGLVWKPERNRRGADMTYSSCWGSWIQAINLVALLLESPESTQRENNYYHSTETVTLALFFLLIHSLMLSLIVVITTTFEHRENCSAWL